MNDSERIDLGRELEQLIHMSGWKKFESNLDYEIKACSDKLLSIPPSQNYEIEMALAQGRFKALVEVKEWINQQIRRGQYAEVKSSGTLA